MDICWVKENFSNWNPRLSPKKNKFNFIFT